MCPLARHCLNSSAAQHAALTLCSSCLDPLLGCSAGGLTRAGYNGFNLSGKTLLQHLSSACCFGPLLPMLQPSARDASTLCFEQLQCQRIDACRQAARVDAKLRGVRAWLAEVRR
eukprot:1151509-Pelagomonas_calceolata.AAC.2